MSTTMIDLEALKARVKGEKRTATATVTWNPERRDGGDLQVSGWAAVFDSESGDLGFIETLAPGCFSRALSRPDADPFLLLAHDRNAILARKSAGTLTLREDARGLAFAADIVPTTQGKDVALLVKSGHLNGCSFGFTVAKDEWTTRDGQAHRRVLEIGELFELTITPAPAYKAADVRNLALQKQLEQTVARSRKARTESPYRPDGQHSWYRDLATVADAEARWNEAFNAGRGPMLPRDGFLERGLPMAGHGGVQEARDRLRKLGQEQRDLTTTATAGGGFVGPAYLGDLFASAARATGVLPSVMRTEQLPDKGMTIKTARITTGTSAAVLATENSSVSETSIVEAAIEEPVATIASQQDMSWALLERAEPGIDSVLAVEMGRAIGEARDRLILAGTGTPPEPHGLRAITGVAAVSYTSGTPTAAAFVPKLAELASRVAAANGSPATHVLAHPRRLAWLASNLSSTFPLQDVMLGLQVVPVTAIGTTYGTGTNQDEVVVIVRDELPILLGPVNFRVSLDWSGSGTATARITAWQYLTSMAARRPEAVGVLSGTGLAAWF